MLLCGPLWVFCGSFVVLCGPLRSFAVFSHTAGEKMAASNGVACVDGVDGRFGVKIQHGLTRKVYF